MSKHDLRVDPSQVIVMVGDSNKVRVRCADDGCPVEGFVLSAPSPAVRLDRPETWRKYRYQPGDLFVER